MNKIDVHVQTLSGRLFNIKLFENETVLALKNKILIKQNVPINQQHLVHNSCELNDSSTLVECGIQHGSVVKLVLHLKGGPMLIKKVSLYKDASDIIKKANLIEALIEKQYWDESFSLNESKLVDKEIARSNEILSKSQYSYTKTSAKIGDTQSPPKSPSKSLSLKNLPNYLIKDNFDIENKNVTIYNSNDRTFLDNEYCRKPKVVKKIKNRWLCYTTYLEDEAMVTSGGSELFGGNVRTSLTKTEKLLSNNQVPQLTLPSSSCFQMDDNNISVNGNCFNIDSQLIKMLNHHTPIISPSVQTTAPYIRFKIIPLKTLGQEFPDILSSITSFNPSLFQNNKLKPEELLEEGFETAGKDSIKGDSIFLSPTVTTPLSSTITRWDIDRPNNLLKMTSIVHGSSPDSSNILSPNILSSAVYYVAPTFPLSTTQTRKEELTGGTAAPQVSILKPEDRLSESPLNSIPFPSGGALPSEIVPLGCGQTPTQNMVDLIQPLPQSIISIILPVEERSVIDRIARENFVTMTKMKKLRQQLENLKLKKPKRKTVSNLSCLRYSLNESAFGAVDKSFTTCNQPYHLFNKNNNTTSSSKKGFMLKRFDSMTPTTTTDPDEWEEDGEIGGLSSCEETLPLKDDLNDMSLINHDEQYSRNTCLTTPPLKSPNKFNDGKIHQPRYSRNTNNNPSKIIDYMPKLENTSLSYNLYSIARMLVELIVDEIIIKYITHANDIIPPIKTIKPDETNLYYSEMDSNDLHLVDEFNNEASSPQVNFIDAFADKVLKNITEKEEEIFNNTTTDITINNKRHSKECFETECPISVRNTFPSIKSLNNNENKSLEQEALSTPNKSILPSLLPKENQPNFYLTTTRKKVAGRTTSSRIVRWRNNSYSCVPVSSEYEDISDINDSATTALTTSSAANSLTSSTCNSEFSDGTEDEENKEEVSLSATVFNSGTGLSKENGGASDCANFKWHVGPHHQTTSKSNSLTSSSGQMQSKYLASPSKHQNPTTTPSSTFIFGKVLDKMNSQLQPSFTNTANNLPGSSNGVGNYISSQTSPHINNYANHHYHLPFNKTKSALHTSHHHKKSVSFIDSTSSPHKNGNYWSTGKSFPCHVNSIHQPAFKQHKRYHYNQSFAAQSHNDKNSNNYSINRIPYYEKKSSRHPQYSRHNYNSHRTTTSSNNGTPPPPHVWRNRCLPAGPSSNIKESGWNNHQISKQQQYQYNPSLLSSAPLTHTANMSGANPYKKSYSNLVETTSWNNSPLRRSSQQQFMSLNLNKTKTYLTQGDSKIVKFMENLSESDHLNNHLDTDGPEKLVGSHHTKLVSLNLHKPVSYYPPPIHHLNTLIVSSTRNDNPIDKSSTFDSLPSSSTPQTHPEVFQGLTIGPQKQPKCAFCGKKIMISSSYLCRCDKEFCVVHRYPEMHACKFDYKFHGRKLLETTNPTRLSPKSRHRMHNY